MRTTIFLRKKRIGENSMEMLLMSLSPYLGNVKILELPEYSTSIKGILKNIQFVKKNHSKVNHIYSLADGYLGLFLSNCILTVHDLDNFENLKRFSRFIIFTLCVYLPSIKIKHYHCISNYTKTRLLKYIPWRKKNVKVIHNPINPLFCHTNSPKDYSKGPIHILHIGTGVRKHLETVIEAIKISDNNRIILDIVGVLSESQLKLLKEKNIKYANYLDISVKELISLYRGSHIVTFPSSAEGFGMIIIEANAIGIPIIAGNIPVLHEVGADSVLFVDPLDVEGMAKAISEIINDSKLRDLLRLKGLENVNRFQIERIAKQYQELYNL